MTFGEKIRGVRERENISLRRFCLHLGYDASNWSKVERGEFSAPRSREKLMEIAGYLGIDEGELLELAGRSWLE